MDPFWKKFLNEGRGIFARDAKPRIHLGAFGKHPGWDDHIDDIGLGTESLLLAKQVFYVDGIGGQIDTGEWEKLTDGKALAEFKHTFVWERGDAFLLGKISSSRDGKNRTKYPMIVCVHCQGIPFQWALAHILPNLDIVESQCKGVQTANEVRSILRLANEDFKRLLDSVQGNAPGADPASDSPPLVERLGMENTREGLYRIVYHVHSQLARYLTTAKREDGAVLRPAQIRLPAASNLPAETLIFWNQFLESLIGKDVPILLTLPGQEPWLDATIGVPTARECFSLRAKSSILTIASEVPYTIEEDFREANREIIQAMMESRPLPGLPSERQGRLGRWFS